jgi:hypothetical protein
MKTDKPTHTTGTWQMCLPENGRPHHIAVFIDGNKAELASVDFSHLRTAMNLIKAKEGREIELDVSYEAQEANANLIAAAPELLDALESSLKFFWRFCEYDRSILLLKNPDHPVFKWESAIEKAKGS